MKVPVILPRYLIKNCNDITHVANGNWNDIGQAVNGISGDIAQVPKKIAMILLMYILE